MNRSFARRLLAEGVGTLLLVAIGTGAIVLGAERGGWPPGVLPLAWGIAVTVAVQLFAPVSGAHLNPAVTCALAVRKRISASAVAPYVGAQFAGAFGGSALVALLIGRAADLGATVPAAGSWLAALVGEVGFTVLLLFAVLLIDRSPRGPRRAWWCLPGVVVALSTAAIGPLSGSSLNLARTLAPAVLSGTYTDVGLYGVAAVSSVVITTLVVGAFGRRARPAPR